ncbi:arginine deiminase [Balneicella halophila]|uniref:arginine deiminase n=1 Tax=Balneicella halophila TaxID=1537566 RepID=A0A7L4UPQ5_BALHA|nr:arginine deiminase family protein [Balneicella halophila]PVX51740.1 arginine deiminase [Balneicella halophila]
MEASQTKVYSEIGKLQGVILHTPGSEVENMTPGTAERALYSDILSLDVVTKEYKVFKDLLGKLTKTYQVKELLADVLSDSSLRSELISKVCEMEDNVKFPTQRKRLQKRLEELDTKALATALIEGLPLEKNNLTDFVSDERFVLRPLHNFFFTRDASVSVYDKVLICNMANDVRDRESLVMQTIFENHPEVKTTVCNPLSSPDFDKNLNIEGGDVLIARDDILIIGNGTRTSTQGVDYMIEMLKTYNDGKERHIIVQELPSTPESFIHMDMVFTLLDKNKCMTYSPLLLKPSRYRTIHITVQGDKVKIQQKESVIKTLKELGMDLEPVTCGGSDLWHQEREQWHSGANFFAFAPGKIIGYRRNNYTAEELNKHGFEILKAEDVISGKVNVDDYERCLVTLSGSELPRGGGGARCMTMPVRRDAVNW